MKTKNTLRAFLLGCLACSAPAHATTYTWTQAGLGSQDWTTVTNWDASTVFVSGSGNELKFFADNTTTIFASPGTQTITGVPATLSMNTLTLSGKGANNATPTFIVVGDNTSTWTIGDGTTSQINLVSASGGGGDRYLNYIIGANLKLNQATTTFTGSPSTTRSIGDNFTGNITEAAAGYGIIKSGSSNLVFSGTNNYTGPTQVTGGILRLNNASALPGGIGVTGGTTALTLNGGILELATGNTNFQRNLGTGSDQFQITGGASGFSAYGGPRSVTVNDDAAQELVWGSADFAPTTLALNSGAANNSLELTNKIDLNGTTRAVQVNANTAIMSGDIRTSSGTAGLTKSGPGSLVLSGANSYDGPTTVTAGTLSVGTTSNLGDAAAGLVFNGGTLQVTGTTLTSISGIGHSVTFNNNAKGFDIQNAANTFTVDQVLNGTTLTKSGAGTLVFNQANTLSGTTSISGGGTLVLDYVSQDNKKLSTTAAALTLGGGNILLRGGSTTEVMSGTTLAGFSQNTISRDGGSSTITLGAIAQANNQISTLALSAPGIASTITANASGIQALGRITVGSHFATKDGSNLLQAYGSYTDYTAGAGGGDLTTVNQLTGGGSMTGTLISYSLRIANSGDDDVLDLAATNLTISNGGTILYAGGSNNNYTINGTTGAVRAGNFNQPVIVNTYTGTLTVNAILTSGGASTLLKCGAGTLVVGSANTYTGGTAYLGYGTFVQQGALLVNNTSGSGTGTGGLSVATHATLGGTGTIGGNTTIAPWGKLTFNLSTAPGSHDKLDIDTGKSLTFSGDSVLTITSSGGATTGLYTLVTAAGGISGVAPSTVVLPVGWTADAPQIVGNDLKINITSTGSGLTGYALWASTNATSGNADDDFDGDGVSNAVEYALGGLASTKDLAKLPGLTTTPGGDMLFTFDRDQDSIAAGTTVTIEVSTDLVNWTDSPSPYAVPDGATGPVNPGVTVVKDTSPGFDTVTLSVQQSPDTKKFARLKVVIAP